MRRRWSSTDAAILIGFCALGTLFSLDTNPANEQISASPEKELMSYPCRAMDHRAHCQTRDNRATYQLPDEFPSSKVENPANEQLSSSPEKELLPIHLPEEELPRDRIDKSQSSNLEASSIFPWAFNNLKPISVPPIPGRETALFWHIPKSGGTTVKGFYKCMHLTLVNKSGHDRGSLRRFRPWGRAGTFYVNADTTSKNGILRAERLDLVSSGLADMIFTNFPDFASEHLYKASNKGRAMCIFRHPVDRLVSKFYYLQIADWEKGYAPHWKNMNLAYWAKEINNDNDHMVKKMAGKSNVSDEDLKSAIRTVKQRFIVGRMDKMEESIRRFNIVMGVDESEIKSSKCQDQFFGHDAERKNTNSHPKVEEESSAWRILAKNNALDIRLYRSILDIFDEQKDILESY